MCQAARNAKSRDGEWAFLAARSPALSLGGGARARRAESAMPWM